MHAVSFPFGTLGVSAESTSAAWTERVPVDQSSLCNIDHFPNLELKTISPAPFGSGAMLRQAAIEITEGPATTGAPRLESGMPAKRGPRKRLRIQALICG